MEPAAPAATLRVLASMPLLQNGLERVARLAGVRLVESDETAAITMRAAEDPPTAGVDLVAGSRQVVLTISALPDAVTWSGLHAVLAELLEPRA